MTGKIEDTKDNFIGTCDGCKTKEIPVTDYTRRRHDWTKEMIADGETWHLCKFCASSRIGNSSQYPKQYYGEKATLETLGLFMNHIESRLNELESMLNCMKKC